ncbi:MAG: GNAT family N-acetyltransferase [Dehalococcoidales bacterium]|nr:GNAT family N-acetyltransferase [Dehalococcoidales bacterium]
MDIASAIQIAKKVLTADLACEEGDFDRDGIHVYTAREVEGARRFPLRENSLNAATFGQGVVFSCSSNRLQWVKDNLDGRTRDDVFSAPVISLMEEHVSRDGQTIIGPDLKYVCGHDTFRILEPPRDIEIKLVEGDEIKALYAHTGFGHALGHVYNPERPTVMAVTAVSGDEIVGIAGVSADAPEMYQLGIDVIPGYRNKGIGSFLVSRLTESVLDMGKVPYYSTWANNIGSRRLALAVGYRPVWVEVYANKVSPGLG